MKKSEQKVSVTINATPEKVWEVVGAVKGVDKWLAPIEACRLDGDKRYCTAEGKEFEEDILKVDHEKREFHYAIPKQHLIPVQNIFGIMKVRGSEDNQSVVDWQWTFDVEEDQEATAKEIFTGMGQMGIKGIEDYITSNISKN